MLKPLSLLFLLLIPESLNASHGVLVPVFYGDPGAYGSLWRSRLTIFNNSAQPLEGIQFLYECGIPEGCHAPLPPNSSLTFIAVDGFRYPTGLLLYPGTENADVSYSLRVYDQSRGEESHGTDVPVVPLESFTEKKLQLLDVPVDSRSRVMLRIYAIPPATPRVRVRIFQDAVRPFPDTPTPPRLLSEQFYDLVLSPFGPPSGSYSRPSAVVVPDVVRGIATTGPVRIEVQSMSLGVPIWAFVSVTNNATQSVTVVVPHPR